MAFIDYYIAGQQAGRERKKQKAFDAASPFIAQAAMGDTGALKQAMAVPDLPVDTVMQLGQWASSASEAERAQAAAKAQATADFTTNYLALPYDQQVGNWGAVRAFAQENGIEAPGAYSRDFLQYYALRSSNFLDTLKKTGPQLAGGAPMGGGMTTTPLPAQGGGMGDVQAIQRLETGGLANPDKAVSPAGAAGRMQVMPGTAREVAASIPGPMGTLGRMASDGQVRGALSIPQVGQKAGETYYAQMLAKYQNPMIAAAAYNAGPGRVDQALAQAGGDMKAFIAALPAETQEYLLGNQNTGRQGFLSLTGAGGAAPGGVVGPPSGPAPAGGAPAGLQMVLGENGQPLSAGDGRVWFAPPDANGAPDWSRAVAQDPAGGQGMPQTTGLPTGYQWGKDAQGNAVAVPIPGLRAEGEKQPATFNQEDKLRDEFTAQTKLYREIESSYSRIKAAAGGDSGQDDIAIIFAYMKMLDPTSVVREGEFATAEATAGIPEQIVQAYNKALQGERLSPEMRQGFLSAAERQMEAAGTMFDQTLQHYQGLAQSYGLDPNRIVRPRGDKPDPGGATSGTVNGVQWKVLD